MNNLSESELIEKVSKKLTKSFAKYYRNGCLGGWSTMFWFEKSKLNAKWVTSTQYESDGTVIVPANHNLYGNLQDTKDYLIYVLEERLDRARECEEID